MDLQTVVDGIAAMTCVVSVEKLEGGGYGDIRIVTGNPAYIDSIEHPAPGVQMLTTEFVPNSLYTRYLTRDLNFEDYCYRSAVQKKCLHSYAHPDRIDAWFNMTFMPLAADEGNLCYCTYTMEINLEPSSERLSNVSGQLASRVLETAIKLSDERDFETTMGSVIQDVREMCESEYCCILLTDDDERSCTVLCEDIAEGSGLRPMSSYIDENFYSLVETWEDTIAGSNCIIAKNDFDMSVVKERNPRWYESLRQASVDSIVLFPLKIHNQLLGYIWACNFDPEDAGKIKETLELATFILASEISNHLLLGRLRVLSSKDMLTGVMNRNEMNNLVAKMSEGAFGAGTSVGIAFADLNGLKPVNDEEGHAAGDRLLKDAAEALLQVFDAEQVFRAGGDEFTVLVLGISQQGFHDKIAALRQAEKGFERLSFAIGGCFEEDCRNVRRALHDADELMYEDKRVYYESHPENRRGTLKDSFHLEA